MTLQIQIYALNKKRLHFAFSILSRLIFICNQEKVFHIKLFHAKIFNFSFLFSQWKIAEQWCNMSLRTVPSFFSSKRRFTVTREQTFVYYRHARNSDNSQFIAEFSLVIGYVCVWEHMFKSFPNSPVLSRVLLHMYESIVQQYLCSRKISALSHRREPLWDEILPAKIFQIVIVNAIFLFMDDRYLPMHYITIKCGLMWTWRGSILREL